MKTPCNLRPAERRDRAAIAGLATDAGLFPAELLEGMIAPYLDGAPTDQWFVATDADDQPLAFAFCELERLTDGTWNLLAIGVHSARRSQGLGRRLVAYLEERLRTAGGRLLIVETLGTPGFADTRRFYQHVGYVEEARIRDFYEAGGDKVVFWKLL